MNRVAKILIILAAAVFVGFLAGVAGTSQPLEVYDSAGQLVASQPSLSGGQSFANLRLESVPWYVSRSAAIAAYVLLFAIVMWGLGMAVNLTYTVVEPARAWQIHKDMSMSFGLLVFVHAFSLLFDRFINFGLLDILVPFYSLFKPVYLSLGIIGFYLLILIIATSLFARLSRPRLWRYSHYLVYPLFIMATIHGFYIGTDSGSLAMVMIYGLASVSFVCLFLYRFIFYPWQRRKL